MVAIKSRHQNGAFPRIMSLLITSCPGPAGLPLEFDTPCRVLGPGQVCPVCRPQRCISSRTHFQFTISLSPVSNHLHGLHHAMQLYPGTPRSRRGKLSLKGRLVLRGSLVCRYWHLALVGFTSCQWCREMAEGVIVVARLRMYIHTYIQTWHGWPSFVGKFRDLTLCLCIGKVLAKAYRGLILPRKHTTDTLSCNSYGARTAWSSAYFGLSW